MKRAHKIRLTLNSAQQNLLNKHFGAVRRVYNELLSMWNLWHAAGIKFSINDIQCVFNQIKYDQFPWLRELNAHATSSEVVRDLNDGFQRFFAHKAKHPKFHSKKADKDSFSLTGSEIRYIPGSKSVRLVKIGTLRLTEPVRFAFTKIYNITVSKRAGQYFIAFNLEVEKPVRRDHDTFRGTAVGIDLGIKAMAVCSDGVVIPNPRISNRFAEKLALEQRKLSRMRPGSNRYNRQKFTLQRLYYRISCCRNDYIHKFTSAVASKYETVVLEDLNVSGMVKNHCLARSIQDVSFAEIRRQFSYKAERLVLADRFYPSSKTCSCCGNVLPKGMLTLSDRTYRCSVCGLEIDRDLNAAINLVRQAMPEDVSDIAV